MTRLIVLLLSFCISATTYDVMRGASPAQVAFDVFCLSVVALAAINKGFR